MSKYKESKQLSNTDIDKLNRQELHEFVEKVLRLLSGNNYEEVKYSKISVTKEHPPYEGSDIDGYSLPTYTIKPYIKDLYEQAKLLKEACEEKYKKLASEPITREEYNKLLDRLKISFWE